FLSRAVAPESGFDGARWKPPCGDARRRAATDFVSAVSVALGRAGMRDPGTPSIGVGARFEMVAGGAAAHAALQGMNQKKRVLVVHPYLTAAGGANSVAAWALQALREEYDVSLATLAPVDVAG